MKILLLGSNGQLGADIVRANALLPEPFTLNTLNRKDIDLNNVGTIKNCLVSQEFDWLINCMAYTNTEEAESNAASAFLVNALSVKEMALACEEKGARFLHISTDYVFNDSQHKTPQTELDPPAPVSIYGASKLMGESLALQYHPQAIILRVASLFGISGSGGRGGNFVETMIRVGLNRETVTVVADQFMSPTSSASVADMILKSIQNTIPRGIYHAVNTGQASWAEFASAIYEKMQMPTQVLPTKHSEYPSKITRPSFSALNNEKLVNLIGPIPTWHAALTRYLIEKGHIQ